MIIKIADREFLDRILFKFTHSVRPNYLLQVVRNFFDLSSYSTYWEFDLSGVFSVHKAYENQGK